ncbi:MAG: aldo/keto reductase [Planctomycetota bacterium]|jgi:predicted oxidoreductase|nr:aldo/keto reductase [Planctomycetota bacterium]
MRNDAQLPNAYHACRLGYGCMRIAGDRDKGRAAVIAAYEAGYRLFDHADIYAGGACESLFGEILKEVSGMRDAICLQGKVGIRAGRYDFSREHLLEAVDGVLKRLGVDRLDVLLLHRIDLLADPVEVAEVFQALLDQGKVSHFGVSNASPSQLRMLQAHSPVPLVANQVEINLDRTEAVYDGTLDQCLELGVSPQAWCPIGGVAYGAWGKFASPAQWRLVEAELDRQAAHYGGDRVGINLAWLLKHPAKIIPLIGSTTPERITTALAASEIAYTREDWYLLNEARRGQRMP